MSAWFRVYGGKVWHSTAWVDTVVRTRRFKARCGQVEYGPPYTATPTEMSQLYFEQRRCKECERRRLADTDRDGNE